MQSGRRKRLKAAGWQAGGVNDFLGLDEQEAALVEVKLALVDGIKGSRRKRRLSQTDLAQRIGSSQSRVAQRRSLDAKTTKGKRKS